MACLSRMLVAGLFLTMAGGATGHWNLEEEYWEHRQTPEEIPAELRPSETVRLAADGPIYYTTGVRVLGYHDVFVEPNLSPTSDVVPDMFREHMAFLKRANYNVVTMAQVNAHITSGTPVPPNAVAITFDDAYRGQYWNAYPIMEEFGFKSTFYVHSNYVGVLTSKDHSTWAELAEKMLAGHDVQSHTVTHPNLTNISAVQLDRELVDSRLAIMANLGHVVDQICYPFGAYNANVIARAQAAGYSYGQTVIGGLNVPGTPPFETRRNLLGIGDTLATFRNLMGYTGTDPGAPIIIDNTDARFNGGAFVATGSTSSHRAQYGTNYHRAPATTGAPSATATWTFIPTQTGRYSLAAWWPGAANGAIGQNSGATYRVAYAGVTSNVLISQTPGTKGQWNRLGVVLGEANIPQTISINNQVSGGTDVYADAVRLELLPGPAVWVRGMGSNAVLHNASPATVNGTDFGVRDIHLRPMTRSFVVANLGADPLTLMGPPEVSGAADFSINPISPTTLQSGQSLVLTVNFRPVSTGLKSATVTIRTDDPVTPVFSLRVQGTGTGISLADNLATGNLWEPLVANVPGYTANLHDSGAQALLSGVAPDSRGRVRVAGWRTVSAGNVPFNAIGAGRHLRAKFSIYSTGQSEPGNGAQVPNFRLRIAQRFAVSAFQEINHFSSADPEGNTIGAELRPSMDPTKPSIYRVDFAPIAVPLYDTTPGEEIQRTFEVLATEPQQQGALALTEASIGSITPSAFDTGTRIKDYGTTNGDFADFFGARLSFLMSPTPEAGFAPPLASDTPGLTVSSGPGLPLTLDASGAPADRYNIVAADLINGAVGDNDLKRRARIEPGFEYRVRFLVGANVPAERNAQIRLRARTAKFVWAHRLEIGGAWAIGSDGTVGNAAIAQQALPGIGTRNPDRHPVLTNAAWFTILFPNPLRSEIRPEFGPGVPLAERMPVLAGMDGPGQDTGGGTLAKSRRDLLFGLDVIDTLSPGPRAAEETGQAILSAIEVSRFPAIED